MKIGQIKLTDGKSLRFGDFNVIIGGNSVGKTTFMLELFSRADEKTRTKWYWFKPDAAIEYDCPDPVKDLRILRESMSVQYDGANRFFYSQSLKNMDGNIDTDGRFRFAGVEFNGLNSIIESADKGQAEHLLKQLKYIRPFITFASCEARLKLPPTTQVTSLSQPPSDAINTLYRNRALKNQIDDKLYKQVRLHLALLDHARVQIDLGLSREEPPHFDNDADDLQKEFDRIDNWKQNYFSSIDAVGHGVRSMVNILVNLLDPVNSIIFIDEPELYIYPAQKRWLGKELVSLSQKQGKQVFLVTHDPIILQGILDVRCVTHILRIDASDDGNRMLRECDLQNVDEISAKRNQDSYLQGLFYQRSIAVEGAADRAFYQVMIEEILGQRIENKDVGFVACGGKGASKNVAYIASHVGLRTAFIYDFDVLLFDISVLRDVLKMFGNNCDGLEELNSLLVREFNSDAKNIKATGAHDQGLTNSFVKAHIGLFSAAMEQLANVGVFIVPNGSLESWAPEVEQKVRFAEIAPEIIKTTEDLKKPLLNFLDLVLTYIGC